MKDVKMKFDVGARKKGRKYSVTDRFADFLLGKGLAEMAGAKKEEKEKPETKEMKPKAETITKAVK